MPRATMTFSVAKTRTVVLCSRVNSLHALIASNASVAPDVDIFYSTTATVDADVICVDIR